LNSLTYDPSNCHIFSIQTKRNTLCEKLKSPVMDQKDKYEKRSNRVLIHVYFI
jgi:hypothetical protein